MALLEEHASDDIATLVRCCHERLQGTRGLVMSLAAFDARQNVMRWLGIGNVSGTLFEVRAPGSSETLLVRSGVVGNTLPQAPRSSVIECALHVGDILVLATDGVRSEVAPSVDIRQSLQRAADTILAAGGTGTDDALVLVAKYRGWHGDETRDA